jgi:FlaA1/EpsC-like NDP-sugar epimerase
LELAIANVADGQKMNRVFQQYRPQIVFHVAAYKHVPLLERHPDEAIRVNVLGSVITSELAHEYGVERFVFVSTDKAVNPSSVMGASKRIGELWMKAMSKRSSTLFTTVRFGNVIGSRGSVLPTFTQQIEAGGPVTVTDPEMHRFFISIPEAACLVLEAASFEKNGGVFMLEMGEEVSILNLACRMIRLRGLRVHKDVGIDFIGMRPGEKLHEELAYGHETKEKTPHPRIYSLKGFNGIADHDTLLGVILILSQNLRLYQETQHLRKGIFQVASGNIDEFLNYVTGMDLTRDWQYSPRDTLGDERLLSIQESYVLEDVAFASRA